MRGGGKADVFPSPDACTAVTISDPDGRTAYVVRGVEDMGLVPDLGRGLAIDVEVTGPVPYWQGAQVRLNANSDEAPVVHFHAPLTVGPYASVRGTPDRGLKWVANPDPRLVRGRAATLSVQVRNREPEPGCQVAVTSTGPDGRSSRFPATVRPVAEIEFPAVKPGGEPIRRRYTLDQVCCGSRFYGAVEVPAEAGVGVARVTFSFDAWELGRVQPNVIDVPVVDPPATGKVTPASDRRRRLTMMPSGSQAPGLVYLSPRPRWWFEPYRSAAGGDHRMNPSYCRIRVPQAAALERFAAWLRLPQVGPLVPADSAQAVRLACDERGLWRGNAVLVSEIGDWTLFSDLSGARGGVPAERWREFAGSDALVFAGYNDAIGYGEFVLVRGGRVVREFLDDPHDPAANANRGSSDVEGEPFESWVDVASFVDADDLGFSEAGLLWVWR